MIKDSVPKVPAETESRDGTVKVRFKNTYIGSYGIFYKKNTYTITKKLADVLKNDIEVL